MTDICNVGDELKVMVIGVDDHDRVKLSRRRALEALGLEDELASSEPANARNARNAANASLAAIARIAAVAADPAVIAAAAARREAIATVARGAETRRAVPRTAPTAAPARTDASLTDGDRGTGPRSPFPLQACRAREPNYVARIR